MDELRGLSPMQLASRRAIGVGAAAVLIAAVAACGTDGSGAAADEPMAQIASDEDAMPAQNGIDELPPEEALDRAITSLEDAGTFRVQGTTKAGSTIDISFKTGEGSVGIVTTDSEVRLVASEGVVYITSDPATLAKIVDADIEDTIADKWLRIAPESSSSYRIFVEGSDFAEAVLGAQVKGEMTSVRDVDGKPAVGLVFAESGGTLWVSAEKKPLPLRFEEKGASGGTGVLTFSDFGAEVKVNVPKKKNVVDPSKLPEAEGNEDGDE